MIRTKISFYLTSYKVSVTVEGDKKAAEKHLSDLFNTAKWGMIHHNGLMLNINHIEWVDIEDTEVVASGLKPAGEADSI